MSWQDPIPEGVGDVEPNDDGFTAKVSIPSDEDGFFGRDRPACESPFKMHAAEYKALPDDTRLSCPYCGHRGEPSAFMTAAQRERSVAAAQGLAQQFMHDTLKDVFGSSFRPAASPRDSLITIETRYTPGSPPPIRELPEIVEDQTRRVIVCSMCDNRYAVYSAAVFCPVCRLRPATDTVLEQIQTAREVFALEDETDPDRREALRAAGVFERFAVDALKSVASLFEAFAREQFHQRIPDTGQLTRGRGNIFQRLDDTAELFSEHAGIDLVALAGEQRWQELKVAFARRHVLTHCDGIIDERFLARVPDTSLQAGQRLVVRRADAESALDDLEALVRALSAA